MEVGLGSGDIVLDRDPSTPKRNSPSQFAAYVYCGQTAGWIRMPLGTEVRLGPGHIVLDGDPTPPQKGHSPQFSAHACCGQTAGWIKMPLGRVVGLGPGHTVLDRDPALPMEMGTAAPHFSVYVFVAKQSPISTTAEVVLHSLRKKVSVLYNGCPFPQKFASSNRGIWTPSNL